MDIKAYYAGTSVRVFTMVDKLKELSDKRLKALEILKEKNFYQIFDSFFEACDGFGFDAELEDSMSWNNRCYTHGDDFINFFKKNAGITNFSVNGSRDNQTCSHSIGFSENISIKFELTELNCRLAIKIIDMDRSRGNLSFLINNEIIYSGSCGTEDTGWGRGKIVLNSYGPQAIEKVILKKKWVSEILPEFGRLIDNARFELMKSETEKLRKERINKMAGNIDISDFE